MAIITDPDFLTQATEVVINTSARTIQLIVAGNLDNDGVTLKAVYSFLKEEWRADAALIRFDFPMTPITDEAMQIGVSSRNNGWRWRDDITRKLIRTGGWQEVSTTGVVNREYSGIISLGTLTPGTAPYYEVVEGVPENFFYTGPVNEAVQVFGDSTTGMTTGQDETNYDGIATNGTFTAGTGYAANDIIVLTNFAIITVDTVGGGGEVTAFTVTLGANATATAYSQFTVTPAGGTGFTLTPAASNLSTIHGDVDYRNLFNVFAREQGDIYAGSTLLQIGVSVMTFQAYRFPLTTAADPKILTADGDITTLAPFTGMSISYRTNPLTVEIGDGLFYDFGIVIDGNNGTAEQIYEFVQYQLRQNSDINEGTQLIAAQTQADYAVFAGGTGHAISDVITLTNGATITVDAISGGVVTGFTVTTTGPAIEGEIIEQASTTGTGVGFSITAQVANLEQSPPDVNGRTADLLLQFVGDTLFTRAGFNPATSTTDGVYIVNFQTADINRLVFTDNTGAERVFPFTATLTLNFSTTLQTDTDATFWVFFTNDNAGDNTGRDFNTAEAILVNDADGVAMTGLVNGDAFRQLSYAYDTNVQRGAASAFEDAPVTAVAIGLGGAQYVLATGTIARSNANSIALVAPQERNYSNPL